MNSISIPDLLKKSEQITTLVKNNFDQFGDFGIQLSEIEALEQKAKRLRNFGKDNVYKTEINKTVTDKKIIRTRILLTVRAIKLHLSFRTGSEKKEIETIAKRIALSSDELTFEKADNIIKRIADWPDYLKTENIILEHIRSLTADVNLYSTALNNNITLRQERQKLTEGRNMLKDEIYRNLSKICDIGKWIYKEKDLETYKSFILFPEQKNKT